VAVFAYGNDALGRRVSRNADTFDYNVRSEVVGESSGVDVRAYAYDAVGNRVWSADNVLTNNYTANRLNQYTAIAGAAPSCLSYDQDGNMLTNGVWSYAWDAENRMTGAVSNGLNVVSNAYDHSHRRVRKETAAGTRRFAYDEWNMTAEVFVDSQSGVTNVTRYIWGPDLSGTLQGAGGVGGLLAEVRGDGSVYFPCYDANGNVTDYLDAYGTVRGHFEYDAFGNTVAMWGDLAHTFRFRFSTKYWDAETQSYYYGYRHYAPKLGCWLNRDPISEKGGLKINGFAGNDPVNRWDSLGLRITNSKNVIDLWIEEIYEVEEIEYDWGKAPIDLLGLGDADIGLTFSCSCINKTSAGADMSCTLTMRPVIRFPKGVESTRAHELRHVAVFKNVYLSSFRALFSEYTASGKCCNCDERATEINKYGTELLRALFKWDFYMEYFSQPSGDKSEPYIDYGGSLGANYNILRKITNKRITPCK